MEPIKTQLMTVEEINHFFNLPQNNDFTSYFEKYENGVFFMDRNYAYTAYLNTPKISYILKVDADAWRDYISEKNKSIDRPVKIYEEKIEYLLKDTLENSKKILHKTNEIKFYKIVAPNVFPYQLSDEESEFMDGFEEEQYDRPNPYDDIPYLGLRADEQETGHWNID